MRILLDSNAYSQWKRGHSQVAELIRSASEILLPLVVVGELLYGFRHGSQSERNLGEFRELLANPRVSTVGMTMTTADRYASVAVRLRRQGRPIPTNDIWIAAHAMEAGADLVSLDQHFEAIDGLAWIHVPQ